MVCCDRLLPQFQQGFSRDLANSINGIATVVLTARQDSFAPQVILYLQIRALNLKTVVPAPTASRTRYPPHTYLLRDPSRSNIRRGDISNHPRQPDCLERIPQKLQRGLSPNPPPPCVTHEAPPDFDVRPNAVIGNQQDPTKESLRRAGLPNRPIPEPRRIRPRDTKLNKPAMRNRIAPGPRDITRHFGIPVHFDTRIEFRERALPYKQTRRIQCRQDGGLGRNGVGLREIGVNHLRP